MIPPLRSGFGVHFPSHVLGFCQIESAWVLCMLLPLLQVHMRKFPEAGKTLVPYVHAPTMTLAIFLPALPQWPLSHEWVSAIQGHSLCGLSFSKSWLSLPPLCIPLCCTGKLCWWELRDIFVFSLSPVLPCAINVWWKGSTLDVPLWAQHLSDI